MTFFFFSGEGLKEIAVGEQSRGGIIKRRNNQEKKQSRGGIIKWRNNDGDRKMGVSPWSRNLGRENEH
jgi:hypothetical protein